MIMTTAHGSANAKINLGLEILRKRPDGYHDLATVFCPISLADTVRCTRTDEGISLIADGCDVPTDASNLCVRAAELLLPYASAPVGVHMALTKQIPVGAGLGGGSSDAATVLSLLNTLWETGRSNDDLKTLALQLGADVPYFINGGLSIATGIGEILRPISAGLPFWIVVVVPPVHVSTAWAYQHVTPRDQDASDLLEFFPERLSDLDALDELLLNDFEDVVLPAFPAIRSAMEMLHEAGLSCIRMSGTGSAVFGLTPSKETAEHAASVFDPTYAVSLTPPAHQR